MLKKRQADSAGRSFDFSYTKIMIVLVFIEIIVFGFAVPNGTFWKTNILLNLTNDVCYLAVLAIGAAFVIFTGNIDLSVGYIITLGGILMGVVTTKTGNVNLGILVCIASSLMMGAINGLLVTKMKISSWLITLSTMYMFRGICYAVDPNMTQQLSKDTWVVQMGRGNLGGVSYLLIIVIVLFVIFSFLDKKTVLGRYLRAIGNNPDAVYFSGIPSKKLIVGAYVLLGFMCSLSTILFMSKSWSIVNTTGVSFNIEAITFVVLGGISTSGGTGRVRGVFLSFLFIGILKKGMALAGISGDIYNFILGVILVLSLMLLAYTEKRKRTVRRESVIKKLIEEDEA